VKEDAQEQIYLHLRMNDGSDLTVFPELVAMLQVYAGFRARVPATLESLKHRAISWCRDSGLSWPDACAGFHGSVALGFVPSGAELAARAVVNTSIFTPSN